LNEINHAISQADAAYSDTRYRDAAIAAYFDLQNARDRYRKVSASSESPVHRDLICHFITVQALILSPICPHICERIWQMLGHKTSIMHATWPDAAPVDEALLETGRYLETLETDIRKRIEKLKNGKKPKPFSAVKVYVAATYPPWQHAVLTYLSQQFDTATKTFPDMKAMFKDLSQMDEVKSFKKLLMPFVAMKKAEAESVGKSALDLTMKFNELDAVKGNEGYLTNELGYPVTAFSAEELEAKLRNTCRPGAPVIVMD
jgi:leucyl-tRNA synthetase